MFLGSGIFLFGLEVGGAIGGVYNYGQSSCNFTVKGAAWSALEGAQMAIESPAGKAALGAAFVGATFTGSSQPGYTKSNLQLGQEVHKNYQYPSGYSTEVILESGKRVDAINFVTKHIIELKPNNPRAIQEGFKQLQGYLDELGSGWTGEVWTY